MDIKYLLNQLLIVNNKVKNTVLQKIIYFLNNNYRDDYLFGVVDLAIYCLNLEKTFYTKSLIEIIFAKYPKGLNFNILKKEYIKYKNNDLFKYYKDSKQITISNQFFNYITKFNYNHISFLSILAFNSNGYIRYNALKALSKLDYHTALPFFIFRVTDWVDDISCYATNVIIERFTVQYFECILTNILLFENLKNFQRQKHNIKKIEFKLAQYLLKVNHEQLINILNKTKNIKIKRLLVEILIKNPNQDVTVFLKNYAIKDYYIVKKIDALLEVFVSKSEYLMYLKHSTFNFQTSKYLKLIDDINLIMPYIYHPSIYIQRQARKQMKKLGRVVTIFDYLDEINLKRYKRSNIIKGFIDMSKKYEYDTLRQLLNDPDPYIKELAFNKLSQLKLIDQIDRFNFYKQ